MAKTFIPSLLTSVRQLCLYITRYRMTIIIFLPEGTETAFNALDAACHAFLEAMSVYDNLEP